MKDQWKAFLGRIKRYSQFVDTYRQAAQTSADPAMAYVNWGIDLAESGEPEKAIEKFVQAAQISPDRPEPFTNWGVTLAKLGRYEEAIAKFSQALKLDPNCVTSLIMWGAVLIETGDMAGAGQVYQRAIQVNPSNPEPFVNWGIALARLGRYEQAIHHFQSAIALFSYQPHVYFLWGAVLAEMGQYEDAIEKFKITVKHMPKHPEAYYFWALVLNRLGRHQEALEKSKLAMALVDDNPEVYLNMGDALANLGNYEAAIHNYRHATHLNPQLADAYLSWGIALGKLGQYDEAIQHFKHALALEPDLIQAHYAWGVALNETRQFEEALSHLALVYDEDPDHLDNLINFGLAHIHTLDSDRGFKLLKEAEKQDARNPQVQFLLGTFLLAQGEPDKASHYLQKALEFKADFTDAAINLSLALCDLEHTQEALRTLRPFLRAQQDSPEVNFFYGTILLRHGDTDEAISKYKRAIELRPDYRDAWLALGELHWKAKQLDKAQEALTQLEQYYPQFCPGLLMAVHVLMAKAKTQEGAAKTSMLEAAFGYAERIIAQEPMNLEALSLQAQLNGQLGHLEQMNQQFAMLLESHPFSTPRIYGWWQQTLRDLGYEEEAQRIEALAQQADAQ